MVVAKNAKSYTYSWETIGLYRFVYIPLLVGVLSFSMFLLITDTPKFIPHGLVMVAAVLFFGFLLFEVIVIALYLAPIGVDDREIKSFRRGGPITIPWNEIEQIYYAIHPGNNIPSPYFSVCIFSKNKLIMFERGIDGIEELMDTIRVHIDSSRAKHINFTEMIRLLCRHCCCRKQVRS